MSETRNKTEAPVTAIQQPSVRGECRRRLRLERCGTTEVHLILEEEDRAGDGLFEEERARVTVPAGALRFMVSNWYEQEGFDA